MNRYDEMLKKANEFHVKHPEVWEYFVQFTMERIRVGFQHYSAKGVFERIRWETSVPTDPGEFKLSNNHTAFYARAFMEQYPQYKGFFRTSFQTSKTK